MILSVSRRTDIPNHYSDWFYQRIKEGFLYVRNPMNPHQVSRIDLSPQVVDCIVFWTKNPANMLPRLQELHAYPYYFQFTLTGYGRDIESGLPDKRTELLGTFRTLAEKIGKNRVIWRYDPIFINDRYTMEYHLKAFTEIAESLKNHTEKVIISFLDFYTKIQRSTKALGIRELTREEMRRIARELAGIAKANGLTIQTCAEEIDLQEFGIMHGSCIDKTVTENILGCRLTLGKDKNQRKECGCMESVEVGTYNTCRTGCRYCYATLSREKTGTAPYDVNSPLLCGTLLPGDKVTERKVKSCRDTDYQLSFS